jgi:hypothetical protein
MEPGNSAAIGVNQGAQGMGDSPESNCKELEKRNTAQRAQLSNDQSASIRGAFAMPGATTVAHGSLNGGAPMGAASRLLPSRYQHLKQGLWAEKDRAKRSAMRKSGSSNVCPGAPFTYEQRAIMPHQSHCESKILESMFAGGAQPSGTLLININWQSLQNSNSKAPCRACRTLLCHAQKECGVNILLCKEDPDEEPRALKC